MTKADIIKALEPFPDNMQVFLAGGKSGFDYGLANRVYAKEIDFMEDPDGEPLAKEKVIIIDEE